MTMTIHVTNTAAAQEISGFSFQINAALAERIKAYAAYEKMSPKVFMRILMRAGLEAYENTGEL